MSRAKKLYLVLIIFLVICVITVICSRMEEKKEKIKNSDEVVLQIESDSVTKLSWECGSQSLAFHKEDGKWLYDEDEEFPVNEEKINEILQRFQELGASFTIEDVEDYGQYGLDDPECTITVETEDKTYEILLGDYSTMDSERYVSTGDGNVYLVTDDPMESFENVTIKDMIQNDETPGFDNATEVSFSGSTSLNVVYKGDSDDTYCEDDIYFAEQDGKSLPLDTSLVENYLSNISNLNLTDYVTYKASGEELKTYGLDEPKLSVNIKYLEDEEEKSFAMDIGYVEDEKDDSENKAYVRIGDSSIIYEISADEYDALVDVSYDTLRHREVITADQADISQIDISLDDASYTINMEEKNDELICTYQDEEIESEDFLNTLKNLEADGFTDEEPAQKKEIGLKIQFKDDKYPELDVEIYRYDGEHCLVTIDGESQSLVERSKVVDLIEAVNAIVLD